MTFAVFDVTLFPLASVMTQRYSQPSRSAELSVQTAEALVLEDFVHVAPLSLLRYHWYFRPSPVAATVNVAVWPA